MPTIPVDMRSLMLCLMELTRTKPVGLLGPTSCILHFLTSKPMDFMPVLWMGEKYFVTFELVGYLYSH